VNTSAGLGLAWRCAAMVAFCVLAAPFGFGQGTGGSGAPDAQIRELANRVWHNAGKANCKGHDCRVAVADFVLPSGETSEWGKQLGDEVSAALAALPGGPQVIERSKVRAYLAAERIPGKLLNKDNAMRWLGQELGATTVLVGRTNLQGDNLRVEMRLLACDKNKAGPIEGFSLPGGAFAGKLQPVESFPKEATLSNPVDSSLPYGGDKKKGITAPTCKYCPDPSYSDAARKERIQGLVLLDVIVSAAGEAEDAIILRGQPFGLNEVSKKAIVNTWQFHPSTRDGQPIRIQVQIEVSFKLY
jgi:TonB family protein